MLTIFALNNAKQAAKYYEEDNYYVKGSIESIAATHWWGKGAEALGLSDYVDPERFVELLNGKIDKNTILERIRHDGGVTHKPGYDLTFSAPKSVSMLAEIGQDFRIYDAHNKAVNAALAYLQSRVSQYRKTVNSHTEVMKADNLIVGKFRHDTSRSVEDESRPNSATIDCQLHTHCVVINAVKGDDGKWRSLFEKPIFDFKMTGGMIYRSALAMELKALGYQIEKTREDGLFEVAGFTRDDIESFSKRRIKIIEVMKEQGLFGVQAAQEVTLNTRASKVPVDREKLHEHWRERAAEIGLDLEGIIGKSMKRKKHGIHEVIDKVKVSEKALTYALDHLGERQSVFQEKDIIRTSLQYALGDIAIDDVHDAIARFKEHEKIVSLGVHQHRDIYTTPKVLERENRIIEVMKAGKNEYDPVASKEAVDLYLKGLVDDAPNAKKPTNCQLKAIEFLACSTDKIVGVQGYAGTGKTTMLNAICRIAEEAGYVIRGSAPSASAADVLRGDTGIKTETLSGLLIELQKEEPNLKKRPEIIILDEASMASTHQMFDLINHAKRLNKRIFLVGDKLQLPAVEAGSPYTLMQDSGLSTTYMTQVVRQEAKDIEWSVKETIHGDVKYAIDAIGNEAFIEERADGDAFKNARSSVNVIDNKEQRLTAIGDEYLKLDDYGRDNTIVLLGANKDREFVNDHIRDGLKEQGIIFGDEVRSAILQSKGLTSVEKQHVYNYEIGDVVRFNKAYRSVGFKRFDYLTVIGIDQEKQELILDKGGKEVRWSPTGSARSKGSALEVFEQDGRVLSAGDYIRWTQNRKNLDIYNTETAKVLKTRGHIAVIELKNKKVVELDLRESINSHWDYAWSSTVYAAQGKKARNVIAQLEGYNPNLTNYRAFYVTISRAVNTIHLYVDDLEKATRTIQEHTGEKSNASEFLSDFKKKHEFEQYIKQAYLKLDGNIHQYKNENERLNALAEHYVDLRNRKKVYLIATDFKDRKRLNSLIRDELKTKGNLGKEDITINSLRRYRIRSHDDNMKLLPGMVVGFQRGYKKRGVVKGVYYTVKSVNDLENKAVLVDSSGKAVSADISFLVARQSKDIEVCKVDPLPLCSGDEIIWTKNYKKEGITAGQLATITEINNSKAIVKLKNSKTITLPLNDPRIMHCRHAYAKSMDDKPPKQYDYGLAYLDERTKSPARIAAIFGAMGKASKGSHVYSHSKDYVVNKLRLAADQDINLSAYDKKEVDNTFYKKLEAFEASKKTVGKAWVSYFESKKAGLDSTESLRNALILDKAHAELASQVISDDQYSQSRTQALGIDTDRLEKYANKHQISTVVSQYEKSSGILRGHYAHIIASQPETFEAELKSRELNKRSVLEESWEHKRRVARLKLTPEERKSSRLVDAYFDYSREARTLWAKIYKAKDKGLKSELSKVAYASHVSDLRNQLAKDIISYPEKYKNQTSHLQSKTKKSIETHAGKFDAKLQREAKRQLVVDTNDWREVLSHDQSEWDKQKHIQHRHTQPSKVYWDKDLVLREAMPKAEEIISGLLSEEKNARLSKGNKIVWGKKNGSVHFHTNGAKEGVVNDYERNIHGDLITFYAKSRGLDWYDGLSELAADIGINPERGSVREIKISPEAEKKKQQAMLDEQKRREDVRQLAQTTWDESQPIAGTIAETYLKKHRGARFDVSQMEVRFHPEAPLYTHKNGKLDVFARKPAMIVRFSDEADKLTAVQCTYLDPKTANKDKSVKIVKNTVGSQWGSAGVIYQGGDEKVIVAEGAETAMSLIQAEPKASIYITGGNMQNVQHYDYLALKHGKEEIHIAADNDLSIEAGSWKSTEAGAKKLAEQGVRPIVSQPETIKGVKTDFNDVYKRYGADEIKRQFVPQYSISPDMNITEETKLQPLSKLGDKAKNTIEISDYRIPDLEKSVSNLDKSKGPIEKSIGDREK